MQQEVSCTSLWKELTDKYPSHDFILEAQDKMSKYTKEDWQEMATEATNLIYLLSELVKYNVPKDSYIAYIALDVFYDHFSKWFFNISKEQSFIFAYMCKDDGPYNKFFDQYMPGLGNYIHDLIVSSKYSF